MRIYLSRDFKDSFQVVNVAEDTFAIVRSNDDSVYSGYGVNQAFVVLEDSVLAFDSGFTLSHAKSLEKAVRGATDKKIRYLVNSHDHSDHVFGNSYFSNKYSSHGLRIISHANCAVNLRTHGNHRINSYKKDENLRRSLAALSIKLPDLTYRLDMHLEIEGTNFTFIHPESGAHTLGDTLLAIPKKGVVFAGDVLFNSYFPNLQDANLESWIEFLNDIDFQTYKRFVPGHGETCGQKEVKDFTEYLEKARNRLLSNDVNDKKAIRACLESEQTREWKWSWLFTR